jgi:hypothetical protein
VTVEAMSGPSETEARVGLEIRHSSGLPAWLMSVMLHATLFIAIGLMAPGLRNPPASETERVVGIALVERTSADTVQYFSGVGSAGTNTTTPAGTAASTGPVGPPSVNDLQMEFAVNLPTGSGLKGVAGGTLELPNASGLTGGGSGSRRGPVGGGQTRTQIFGANGDGSEFVYVFDRSSSMGGFGGRPLAAAKVELQRSLSDLVSGNQFQIIFYNEQPSVFNPFRPNPPKMFFGTDENKQLAKEYIQTVSAAGGTAHRQALELALRMGPDVIFFLTDAAEPELTASELADLRKRNRAESMINAIEFGSGPFPGGENFLIRLARQNRGQHVYVDVTKLGVDVK